MSRNNQLVVYEPSHPFIGKIFFTDKNMIKVSSVDDDNVYGYDLETEEFIKAEKLGLLPFKDSMMKLVTSDRAKVFAAEHILSRTHKTVKRDDMAAMLRMSARTLFRILDDEDILKTNDRQD